MTSSKEHRPNINHALPGRPGEEENHRMKTEEFPDIPAGAAVTEFFGDEDDAIADLFSEESFTEFLSQYDSLLAAGEVPSYTAEELAARAEQLSSLAEAPANLDQSQRPAVKHSADTLPTRRAENLFSPPEAADCSDQVHTSVVEHSADSLRTHVDGGWASARDALAALAVSREREPEPVLAVARELTEEFERFNADLRLHRDGPHSVRMSFLISGMVLDEASRTERFVTALAEVSPRTVAADLVLQWFVPAGGTRTAGDSQAGRLRLAPTGEETGPTRVLPPPRREERLQEGPTQARGAVPLSWLPPGLSAWLNQVRKKCGGRPQPARPTHATPLAIPQQRPLQPQGSAVSSSPHVLMVALPTPAEGQQWASQWEAELALRWHEHGREQTPDVVAAVLLLRSAHASQLPSAGAAERAAALMIPVPKDLSTEQNLTEIKKLVADTFHQCTGKEA